MLKIHLRDPNVPKTALHLMIEVQPWQLTDDPKQVTCRRCRKMMERHDRYIKKEK